MTAADPLDLLDTLITQARKAGADAADALLVDSIALSHRQRLGRTEQLERSETSDIGLRVFIGQRMAIVSSADRKPEALVDLVDRAIAMAKVVPEDPYCGLADPSQLATSWNVTELELADPVEPTPQDLIDRATACEEAALAVPGVSNSEGAEASWSQGLVYLAASNGFRGSYAGTGHSISASVIAGEATGMETDYDYSSAVFAEDLRDPADIGRTAGERTVRRLGATKLTTGKRAVVFDPRVSSSLIRHFIGAISGPSIARGTSFLKDQMGETVFGNTVTILDDPSIQRGHRSKPFDGEGLPTARKALIDKGQLTTWLTDLRSARQLRLSSTGNASRGTSSPPSPSPTNLYMTQGARTPDALIGEIEDGLYITQMMGMGVNGVTGDYSRGATGFRIKAGELAEPINEVTIAGNLKDMFARLEPANDLVFRTGIDAPTIRIDGMTIAGT